MTEHAHRNWRMPRLAVAMFIWAAGMGLARSEGFNERPVTSGLTAAPSGGLAPGLSTGQQLHLEDLARNVRSLYESGKPKDAYEMQKETVSILEATLGKSNWQAKREQAFLAEIEKCRELSSIDYQKYSAACLLLIQGVGLARRDDNRYAEHSIVEASKVFESVLGENCFSMARSYEWLGTIHRHLNNPEKARDCVLRAAKIRKSLVGDDHPDYANALGMAGDACIALNDFAQAEELIRKALTIDRRTFGNDSLRFAGGLNLLSRILIEQGKLSEAEAATQHALRLIEMSVEPKQIQAAYSLSNLADINIRYGDSKVANSYLAQSLLIYERNCPPRSLAFAINLERHAELLRRLNEVDRATAIEERIASIRSRIK